MSLHLSERLPGLFATYCKDVNLSDLKVIHIGANDGREAEIYSKNHIRCWHVEPIPSIFTRLQKRCELLSSQFALNACLSSEDGLEVEFNVSTNSGRSSSLFPLGRHKKAYPGIDYCETIKLTTSTLDGLISAAALPKDCSAIVIDAQGAELKILEGGVDSLRIPSLAMLIVEVSVVPLYEGSVSFLDVASFLQESSFYLKEVQFNEAGWADAIFLRKYWP